MFHWLVILKRRQVQQFEIVYITCIHGYIIYEYNDINYSEISVIITLDPISLQN